MTRPLKPCLERLVREHAPVVVAGIGREVPAAIGDPLCEQWRDRAVTGALDPLRELVRAVQIALEEPDR